MSTDLSTPDKLIGRQPGLDGLRGAAVLLVVLFHLQILEFGWLGVSLFFVLSGHLITRVLMSRPELGRLARAKDFARNRLIRLGPMYFLCVAVITVVSLVGGYALVTKDLAWLWTWTYNLRTLSPEFGISGFSGYVPMWSLGVEVQLYLLWGMTALLLPRRWFRWMVLVLAIGGPLVRVLGYLLFSSAGVPDMFLLLAIYMSPLTYVDAFALGACTALPEVRAWLARFGKFVLAISVVGVCAVFAYIVLNTGQVPIDLGFPVLFMQYEGWIWQYWLVALLFAMAVYYAGESTRFQQLLSVRPFVRLGHISYSLYLLHATVIFLFTELWFAPYSPWSLSGVAVAVGAFVVSVVLAELTYRLVESPFLRLKRRSLVDVRARVEESPA